MALREIIGPAGRLEALLEEPQPVRTVDADGLVHAGRPGGVRAAVVLGHPHTEYGGTMHTKVIYQTAKALPNRLRRSPHQLPRCRRERRDPYRRTRREG